jgi:beta-lactamase superfamily II metal-dependent hydrolase
VPIKRRFETREPSDYYGVVEEVVDADLQNARTGSGYQLRYEQDGRAVLLTGDTRYDLIQPHMLAGIGGLTLPDHAGRSNASPPVSIDPWRAIASYGDPNSYRHPHAQTLTNHQSQGWQTTATATTPVRSRGNRRLFP